jgi:TetR/AcrR family transcriptional repressor of nem operon
MGRPREFEMDEVLDAAMQAFWTHGYEATSMADLMEAMGLQKGSIYKAFGDKHSLFLQAFQRYVDYFYGQTVKLFTDLPPAEAVRAWIEHGQSFGKGSTTRRGCLFCNTVVELAPHDDEVLKVVQAQWKRMMKLLTDVIRKGQEKGDFRKDVPAERLARYIAVCASGAAASSKGKFQGLDTEDLSDLVYSALTL